MNPPDEREWLSAMAGDVVFTAIHMTALLPGVERDALDYKMGGPVVIDFEWCGHGYRLTLARR